MVLGTIRIYSGSIDMYEFEPIEIDPKKFLYDHCTLPALPAAVTFLQKKLYSDDITIDEIVDSVKSDPSFVAQILKVVNSAYFSLHKEIEDIKFAVAYLGLHEINRIILSISVVNSMDIDRKDELKKFWFHSFYTALCTKLLARRYEKLISPEGLWSAAILHDIGKLVYLKFFPKNHDALVKYSAEHGCLFSDAENNFSAPKSSFMGGLLCERWRLPARIRRACEYHSLADLKNIRGKSLSDAFIRIICLGNLMAVLSHEELAEETKKEVIQEIIDSLECTEADFLTIMGDIYELKLDAEKFVEAL